MSAADSIESVRRLASKYWDVIVVGTGMGGATAGYALAKAGKRVLFCERGKCLSDSAQAIFGAYPEQLLKDTTDVVGARQFLLRGGRYAEDVIDASSGRLRRFIPFMGAATGGSTSLYGMALERLFPSDFHPQKNFPQADGASLVESWPISYAALAPFYAAAERLYRVRGSVDPLRPAGPQAPQLLSAPPLSPAADGLFRLLQAEGMHPYRLPQACEFVEGCEGCQGYLCHRGCRNDSERICLTPAIREHGASLLDECDVSYIEADLRRVTRLRCAWRGTAIELTGRHIVLAAGALQTPNLLLRSTSKDWPRGLANGSGLVGRNLMRHFIDLYAVRRDASVEQDTFDNRQKEIAFNDLYQRAGSKLGSVQSFGRLPPAQIMFAELQRHIRDGWSGWMAPIMSALKPALIGYMRDMVKETLVLAAIVEDLPYADNQVAPGAAGAESLGVVEIRYRISPHEKARIKEMRRSMAALLKTRRFRLLRQAANNERIAHACGTCRFGTDATASVLDPWNKAHELDNLYVVDSSFFPSSGGTNPSLTIAANALRVAQDIGR